MNSDFLDEQFIMKMKKDVEESELDAEGENIFKLATLYTEFNIGRLRQDALLCFDTELTDELRDALKDNCTYNERKGLYCLHDAVRTQVLSRMSMIEIEKLLRVINRNEIDWRQNLLNRLLLNEATDVKQLQPSEYVQAITFVRWIKHSEIRLPSEAQLRKKIRQNDLLLPLRKLTDKFNGREKELLQISSFVNDSIEKYLLYLTGVGGIGKSTLVSKFILDQLTKPYYENMPFVHIDFDNPEHNVSDIFGLLKEALSQLSLQNEQYEDRFNELIKIINDEYAHNKYITNTSRESDRDNFYRNYLEEKDKKQLKSFSLPVVIVFDSFEELQYKSSTTEISILFLFLDEIKRMIPTLKAIFVGRAEITRKNDRATELCLDGFDLLSATSFVTSLGIENNSLSEAIFQKFGGNPLTLQLAANLVLKEIGHGRATKEEVEKIGLFEKIDQKLIQQQLVARNLDHIHNKEVAAIAVPGILLRRIDEKIIKEVLAGPCGLGEIDDAKAKKLFDELKKESFLLKQTNDRVEFLKELRVSLYDLILKEPRYKALQIHDAAVTYYKNRSTTEEQAEYLFHRLKRGDNISCIDEIFQPEMKPFMETALSELPIDARTKLSRLMGIDIREESLEEMSLDRWEFNLLAQIMNVMEIGDENLLGDMRVKLQSRKERTGNPEFLYYERLVSVRLLNHLPSDMKVSTFTSIRRSEVEGLDSALLRSYEAELNHQFNDAFRSIDFDENWFRNLHPTKQNIKLLVECYFSLNRLNARLNWKNTYVDLGKIIEEKMRILPDLGEMTYLDIFSLFPKIYVIPLRERFEYDFPNTNLNVRPSLASTDSNRYALLRVLSHYMYELVRKWNRYLTDKEFLKHYYFLKSHLKNSADLEHYVRRIYKVYMKEISLPGTLEVCLHDFVCFAEAMPRNTPKLILEKLSNTSDFADKTNIAEVQDFTNLPSVISSLEKLEKTFLSGKRKLIVSDVVDDEGHQYVNLVQRSSGVHNFALLGYTYILEKMGIRFLKIAGVQSGTINTALLGIIGQRNEAKTEKLIEHLTQLDFSKLLDGHSFSKQLLKIFRVDKSFLNRFIRILPLIFLLFAFTVIADVFILFQIRDLDSTLPTLLILFSAIFFATLAIVLFQIWNATKRILRFGSGFNPGNYFFNWLSSLFQRYRVFTIQDLIDRSTKSNALRVRDSDKFNPDLLKGDISFVCTDVISQKRIQFPQMTSLLWTKENVNAVNPALFVRASASIPIFFESVIIDGIPIQNDNIKQAWIDTFGEFEPPSSVCLVDSGESTKLPINLFQTALGLEAPLPTFGVDTTQINEKINVLDVRKLSWLTYIQRLMVAAKNSLETEHLVRGKLLEKAICHIKIEGTGFLNYFLTDEEKIKMFEKGAQEAADFLVEFDWEAYKKTLNTQTSLRL